MKRCFMQGDYHEVPKTYRTHEAIKSGEAVQKQPLVKSLPCMHNMDYVRRSSAGSKNRFVTGVGRNLLGKGSGVK